MQLTTKSRFGLLFIAHFLGAIGATLPTSSQAESPPSITWIRQFGTSAYDKGEGVAVDGSGNVYIAGFTEGNLAGPNAGSYDLYLRKYSSTGNELWTRQIGTSSMDYEASVAVDVSGNAFITGSTMGSLGGPNAGGFDAFVRKYGPSGNVLWSRQVGSSNWDNSYSVTTDALGNAYITGQTNGTMAPNGSGGQDPFLIKYDPTGGVVWSTQIGTSSADIGRSVAADSLGNTYVTGWTQGSISGPNPTYMNVFLNKYDATGGLLWTKQVGTSSQDYGESVAVDGSGNVYISGYTGGSLAGPSAGNDDVYLLKYDSAGNQLWAKQFGTSQNDNAFELKVDLQGNSYITGMTFGSLGGPNAGTVDAFLTKIDSAGGLLWSKQIGTGADDASYSVALDGVGNVYIGGETQGALGASSGNGDAFLAKFALAPVPEPSSLALLGSALVVLALGSAHRSHRMRAAEL